MPGSKGTFGIQQESIGCPAGHQIVAAILWGVKWKPAVVQDNRI
jgi:hypothetical protein